MSVCKTSGSHGSCSQGLCCCSSPLLLSTFPNRSLSSPLQSFPGVPCHSLALISKVPLSSTALEPSCWVWGFLLLHARNRLGVHLPTSSPLRLLPTCRHEGSFEAHAFWLSTLRLFSRRPPTTNRSHGHKFSPSSHQVKNLHTHALLKV